MTLKNNIYAVIMAGGGGTRLWPVSRIRKPKQLLPLIGSETLFQNTFERMKSILPLENIFVVTIADQAAEMKQQVPALPQENFLIEPSPKGTASVIGLAAKYLYSMDPDAIMIVLPADHYIKNQDLFGFILRSSIEVAKNDYLVTLGISPTFPATGFGYIQQGSVVEGEFGYPAYKVVRFKEKPDLEIAQEMLRTGNYSWNSGIFVWKASSILVEFQDQMPDLVRVLAEMNFSKIQDPDDRFHQLWSRLVVESIDYGVMEKAKNVAVLPASGLGWSDVGSWDSLFEVLISDNNGNIVVNHRHIQIETNNSLVYCNHGKNRLCVTIGVDDLAIIDTEDVLLVCKTDQSQKVKDVVSILKQQKMQEFL